MHYQLHKSRLTLLVSSVTMSEFKQKLLEHFKDGYTLILNDELLEQLFSFTEDYKSLTIEGVEVYLFPRNELKQFSTNYNNALLVGGQRDTLVIAPENLDDDNIDRAVDMIISVIHAGLKGALLERDTWRSYQ